MSYDITLESTRKSYKDFNYTSNTYEMFRLAFDCKEGIKFLNRMSKKDAEITLLRAIQYFKTHKQELEELNPANGWGCYESSLKLLENIYIEIRNIKNKNLKVYVSC